MMAAYKRAVFSLVLLHSPRDLHHVIESTMATNVTVMFRTTGVSFQPKRPNTDT